MACLVSTAACILNLAACGNDSVVSQGKETTVSGSSVNHSDWLAAWTAAPTDAGRIPPLLPGQVLRQMIAPHADGETLRLKLSNELGGSVISLASVTVGLQETGASIKKGTLKPLLFKGQPEVTIEPGKFVYSDLIAFPVRAFGKVAISLSPVNVIAEMPHHFTAREVPYIAIAGASTDRTGDNGFVPLTADVLNSWSIISSLEVEKKDNRKTIVALGDSITDGFIGLLPSVGSPEGVGQDVRYPDFLARRMISAGMADYSVVNAGISGNRVSADGLLPLFGQSLLKRLERDVLNLPNVRTVLLLEGINDLGLAPVPDAESLILDLEKVVRILQAKGLRVLHGTLTPSRGAGLSVAGNSSNPLQPGLQHGRAEVDAARQIVNTWIRTQSPADGVVDFDACLKDPNNPSYLLPKYDGGDHLHPSSEGYKAMGECVDLKML
jgi:lysophospholipase L1-like esterase